MHHINRFNKTLTERYQPAAAAATGEVELFMDALAELGYDPFEAEIYYETYATISNATEFIEMSSTEQGEALAELEENGVLMATGVANEAMHYGHHQPKLNGTYTLEIGEHEVEVTVEHQPAEFGRPAVNYLIDTIKVDGKVYYSDEEIEMVATMLGYNSYEEMEEEIIKYLEEEDYDAWSERDLY